MTKSMTSYDNGTVAGGVTGVIAIADTPNRNGFRYTRETLSRITYDRLTEGLFIMVELDSDRGIKPCNGTLVVESVGAQVTSVEIEEDGAVRVRADIVGTMAREITRMACDGGYGLSMCCSGTLIDNVVTDAMLIAISVAKIEDL